MEKPATTRSGGAVWVGLGILLSRITGLVREIIFAHYLGRSAPADAFRAALRIPNFLQNLLGEGVLSASFIPVYAKLRAEGQNDEADRLAKSIGGILFLGTGLLTALGIALAPFLTAVIAPGFTGEKAELTTRLVRIFFPAIAVLVQSAWCLGILNSHRKFFLSYVAPVAANFVLIGALAYWGPRQSNVDHTVTAAWAFGGGALLQFLVQLPTTLSFLTSRRPRMDLQSSATRKVARNFFPVLVSRGVVQVSAYLDSMIASLMPDGAVSALSYSQILYTLPISLFGMAVSAAELPEMASARGDRAQVSEFLKQRLEGGFRKIAFFVIPTAMAFIAIGGSIVGAIFQSGEFHGADTRFVWSLLAATSLGLLASTQSRLLSSAFYALGDTRRPLRIALLRVGMTTVIGLAGTPRALEWAGLSPVHGPLVISLGFGLVSWVEFDRLKRALEERIGALRSTRSHEARLFGAALIAALAGYFAQRLLFGNVMESTRLLRALEAVVACGVFGAVYLLGAYLLKVPELRAATRRFRR